MAQHATAMWLTSFLFLRHLAVAKIFPVAFYVFISVIRLVTLQNGNSEGETLGPNLGCFEAGHGFFACGSA